MTDKLLCPFCQQELRPLAIGWCCDCGLCADKELWQRLIRTRKALDCAINTLETVYGMSEDASNIESYVKCKRIEINRIIKGGDNE